VKLYWRVKINGKWTWRAAKVIRTHTMNTYIVSKDPIRSEEE